MTQSAHPYTKVPLKYLLAGLVGILAVAGLVSAAVLVKDNQDVRQQAAGYTSCFGGVAHGAKSCSGFRQYVVCNNGLFSAPQNCGTNQMCQSGSCVAIPPRDCAVTEDQTLKNGTVACQDSRTLVTCQDGSWVNPRTCAGGSGSFCANGQCQSQKPTGQVIILYTEKATRDALQTSTSNSKDLFKSAVDPKEGPRGQQLPPTEGFKGVGYGEVAK